MNVQIMKYNPFSWISGLHKSSEKLAGKSFYLDRQRALRSCDNIKRSHKNDRSGVFQGLGNQLLDSRKFPGLTRITFSRCTSQVRDFIRLVVRTEMTLDEAASETGVKIEDLSQFQMRTPFLLV
jgi:hypothetical protein